MSELEIGFGAFILLYGSYWLAVLIQPFLRTGHRSQDSVESVRLVIMLLATFAAVVLGMVISASQARFSAAEFILRGLSTDITELDQRLREYGPETDPLRAQLILYTKVALADLWPEEPAPSGDYRKRIPLTSGVAENVALGDLLTKLDLGIHRINPTDALHRSLATDLRSRINALLQQRWTFVADAGPALPQSFVVLLIFWLSVIFLTAGISSPRNSLVAAITGLAALSLASSIYLALELDTPLTGSIKIPSAPMRGALQHIVVPPVPPDAP